MDTESEIIQEQDDDSQIPAQLTYPPEIFIPTEDIQFEVDDEFVGKPDLDVETPGPPVEFERSIHQLRFMERFKFDYGYIQDGNIAFYTPANIQKRRKLQQDPDILQLLKRFYVTYRTRKNTTRPRCVHKTEVTFVNVLISKALFDPKDWRAEDAWKAVEEDWEREAKGEEWMTQEQIVASIFEIADVWTDDVKKSSYVTFLNDLYQCITKPSDTATSLQRQWTTINDVESVYSRSNSQDSIVLEGFDDEIAEESGHLTRVNTAKTASDNLLSLSFQEESLDASLAKMMGNTEHTSPTNSKYGQHLFGPPSPNDNGPLSPFSDSRPSTAAGDLTNDQTAKKFGGASKATSKLQPKREAATSRAQKNSPQSKKDDKVHSSTVPAYGDETSSKIDRWKKALVLLQNEKQHLITGKLEGGKPLNLYKGHRIELRKDLMAPGNARRIGVSSVIFYHLLEGDELVVGDPNSSANLYITSKNDQSLFCIVGSSFCLKENETLSVAGLSYLQKPNPNHGFYVRSQDTLAHFAESHSTLRLGLLWQKYKRAALHHSSIQDTDPDADFDGMTITTRPLGGVNSTSRFSVAPSQNTFSDSFSHMRTQDSPRSPSGKHSPSRKRNLSGRQSFTSQRCDSSRGGSALEFVPINISQLGHRVERNSLGKIGAIQNSPSQPPGVRPTASRLLWTESTERDSDPSQALVILGSNQQGSAPAVPVRVNKLNLMRSMKKDKVPIEAATHPRYQHLQYSAEVTKAIKEKFGIPDLKLVPGMVDAPRFVAGSKIDSARNPSLVPKKPPQAHRKLSFFSHNSRRMSFGDSSFQGVGTVHGKAAPGKHGFKHLPLKLPQQQLLQQEPRPVILGHGSRAKKK